MINNSCFNELLLILHQQPNRDGLKSESKRESRQRKGWTPFSNQQELKISYGMLV